MRHFIVTAHLIDEEDDTYYVMAPDGVLAQRVVEKKLHQLAIEEELREKEDDIETYVTMVAEIPGPPIKISTPFGNDETPTPLMYTETTQETELAHDDMVRQLMKNPDILQAESTPFKWGLLHAVIGIVGELAEVDMAVDNDNLLEEAGDTLFYCRNLRQVMELPAFNLDGPRPLAGQSALRLIGDLTDHIKRLTIYNYAMDDIRKESILKLVDEVECHIGDKLVGVGYTRELALNHNIDKLLKGKKARYKAGYSDEAAQARADKEGEQPA